MSYTFILIARPGAAQLRRRGRPGQQACLAGVADRLAFVNLRPQKASFAP
ncbi:MAG: hypothetical protein JWQ33_429 [Ramlibacter sp.]|nr:hypothetical protein [Ramlibacter sp.]